MGPRLQKRIIHAKGAQSVPSKIKPAIISPRTHRPMVEDVYGTGLYKKLKGMLEKDERLTPEMRLTVLFNVLKRKQEIADGRTTLSDIAREEAERTIRKKAS